MQKRGNVYSRSCGIHLEDARLGFFAARFALPGFHSFLQNSVCTSATGSNCFTPASQGYGRARKGGNKQKLVIGTLSNSHFPAKSSGPAN